MGGYVSALFLRGRIIHPETLQASSKVYHVHVDTGATHSMFPEEVLAETWREPIDRGAPARVFFADQPVAVDRESYLVDFYFGPCDPADRLGRLAMSEQQMLDWKGTCATSHTTRGGLSPACLLWTQRPEPICAGSEIDQENDRAGPPIILLGMDLLSRWHLDINGADRTFELIIPA